MRYNPIQITMLFIGCMLCFTSCSSDSGYEPEADRSVEMSFDVASESRATTSVIDEFSVYGDMKFQAGDADPIVTFNKTSVVNRNGGWRYVGAQYWFPKHEHSFVAVSPSSVLEPGNSPEYSGSKLTFTYIMPTYSGRELQEIQDKSEVADLVAATHRRLYKGSDDDNVITLRFGHLLSKINFVPKLDDKTIKADDYIRIHKFEISGLKKRAKIAITPAQLLENHQTDDRLIEISDYEGNDNMTIVFPEPKVVGNGASIVLFDEDDAIIMLPQSFAATSEAKVTFTYTFSDAPENLRQGTIALNGVEWNRGKSYVYHFTIDNVGLNLGKTTIESWTSVNKDVSWEVQ